VTMKNIPITVGFSIVTVCQLVIGVCAVVFAAKGGGEAKFFHRKNHSHPRCPSRSMAIGTV
jgi:hypothetical protein